MCALVSMPGIYWLDHIISLEILDHAEYNSIESILVMVQLSLVGRVLVCRSTVSPDTARFDEHAHGQGHYV